MKGNNNGGDWRKLIILLAFGLTVIYVIEVGIVSEIVESGTRLREALNTSRCKVHCDHDR